MSEPQKKIIQSPSSPPMDIPKKERSVFNSFFPESSNNKNIITRSDIIRQNNLQYSNLIEELDEFKKVLHVFTELEKGEKLGKQKIEEQEENVEENVEENIEENDKTQTPKEVKQYYKQQPYTGMWITRWWYSESREKTVEYLDEDFTKFMNYLDRILTNIKCDPTGLYVSLVNDIREFINSIIQGLYNLKQTYPETVKVVAKVDSIILTLLDFKEKTDDYLAKKKQNVRLTVIGRKIPVRVDTTQYDEMPPNSI